jgi:SAM-dependent methyltransferase
MGRARQLKRALLSFYEYAVYRTVGILNVVRWLEWPVIERWAAIRSNERVLDAACGRGSLTLRLAKRTGTICGFDMSSRAVRRARRVASRGRSSARFLVADAERLPFKDASFDTIVSSSSLEHFCNGQLAVDEMARVLRTAGRLVLTTDNLDDSFAPALRERHRRAASVAHYYTEDELLGTLQQHFEVPRTRYLINSPVSKAVYRLGVRLDWGGTVRNMMVWLPVCALTYPICYLSDRAFGSQTSGYTFMAEAVKRG